MNLNLELFPLVQAYLNQHKNIFFDIVSDAYISDVLTPNKACSNNHFILYFKTVSLTTLNQLLKPIDKEDVTYLYNNLDKYIHDIISHKNPNKNVYNVFYEYQRLCKLESNEGVIVLPIYRGFVLNKQQEFFTFKSQINHAT